MVKNKIIPSDIQEAADKYIGYPHEVDEGVSTSMRRDAYADGMLAERERLMKEAIDAQVMIPIPSTAYIKERNIQELRKYIVDNFKHGDKVSVIIIKKEK